MKELWRISWHQPTEDYRPLTYPPHERIIGWWCSGQRGSDDAWTMMALVYCPRSEAEAAILQEWPEAFDWRFCQPRPVATYTTGDRFPMQDWMAERLEVARLNDKMNDTKGVSGCGGGI